MADVANRYAFEVGKIQFQIDLLNKTKVYNKITRGHHPNESQNAVIIDVMKTMDEIISKIWPVVQFFIPLFDLDPLGFTKYEVCR